jgi:hypothetical protein
VIACKDRSLALTRRDLGIAAAGVWLAGRATAMDAPEVGTIACKVVRAGRDIGRATYTFTPSGDDLTVAIAVDLHIRFGFITLFHYSHSNAEHWHGGRLVGFTAHTNNNGQAQFCTARRSEAGIAVTGSGTAPYVAPPEAIGTSYWNPRTLTDPLINSQTGKLLSVSLAPVGQSRAVLATGATVPATEYRMSGDLRMNLWYDAAKRLAGLQYYARDGSVLTYEEL